jgi:hypothetical protein
MKKLIKSTERHEYRIPKGKVRKVKAIMEKWHKKRFTYIPKFGGYVGCDLFLNGKYYASIVADTRQLWFLNNKYHPNRYDMPFAKCRIGSIGFKVVDPKVEEEIS